jgi:hypothetical protein
MSERETYTYSKIIAPDSWEPSGMQCIYDRGEWDVGFFAETTPQQRANLLEQFEAKGMKP